MEQKSNKIYLAGGCFWGMEKLMQSISGVLDAVSGYANGTGEQDADYKTVCTGKTGFREAVAVTYDPKRVTLDQLLFAYFEVVDPTAVNRQGHDVGSWADHRHRCGVRIVRLAYLRHPTSCLAAMAWLGAAVSRTRLN